MKRFIRILLTLIATLVVITILLVVSLIWLIDPNDYKQEIATFVAQKTGRKLVIEGDIHLTFYPWVGLNLGKVTLGNAPNFAESTFAKVDNVQLRVRLIPLFHKIVEMDTLVLEGMALTLIRTAKTTNWEDVQRLFTETSTPNAQPSGIQWNINGLNIKNATLVWEDQTVNRRYTLANLSLETTELLSEKPIAIKMASKFTHSGQKPFQGDFNLTTQVATDFGAQQYRIAPMRVRFSLKQDSSPALALDVDLDIPKVDLDLVRQQVSISQVSTKITLSGSAIPENKQSGLLTIRQIRSDWKQQLVNFDVVVLSALNSTLSSDIEVTHLASAPTVMARVNWSVMQLRQWLRYFPNLPDLPLDKLSLQKAAFQSQVKLDKDGLRLQNVVLEVDSHQFKSPELFFSWLSQSIELNSFALQLFGVGFSGKLSVTQVFSRPLAQGELVVMPFNPQELLKFWGQSLPLLPAGLKLDEASLRTRVVATPQSIRLLEPELKIDDNTLRGDEFAYAVESQQLRLDKLVVEALGIALKGDLEIMDILKAPRFQGSLRAAPFNLRQVLTRLGYSIPATGDAAVFGEFAFDTQAQGSVDDISLEQLTFKLDQTVTTGHLSVKHFKQPEIAFHLVVDQVNVDRYLPPQSDKKEGSLSLPLALFDKLEVSGDLKIAHLKVAQLQLDDAQLTVTSKAGKLKVSSANAALYQGTSQSEILFDANRKPPTLDLKLDLNEVQLETLLIDTQGYAPLTGKTTLSANLMANLQDLPNWQRSLTGMLDFSIQEGTLKGIDMRHALYHAKALIKGEKPPSDEPIQTDFTHFEGKIDSRLGSWHAEDLQLISPWLHMKGFGHLAIQSQDVEVHLKTTITADESDDVFLQELRGIVIPVLITGKLTALNVQPYLQGWLLKQNQTTEQQRPGFLETQFVNFIKMIERQLQRWHWKNSFR